MVPRKTGKSDNKNGVSFNDDAKAIKLANQEVEAKKLQTQGKKAQALAVCQQHNKEAAFHTNQLQDQDLKCQEKLKEQDCLQKVARAQIIQDKVSKDAAVAAAEAAMAMSKITADKELAATQKQLPEENNKEVAKQKEVHHPGSEFA
jgi:hypothetical protein